MARSFGNLAALLRDQVATKYEDIVILSEMSFSPRDAGVISNTL